MRPTASCQEARQRPLPPATCRRARRASGCVRCPRRAGPTSRPTSSSRTRTRRRARRFTPPRRKSRPDYAQMHRCLVALPPPQAKGAPRFARWRACHGCHRAAPACGHAASAQGPHVRPAPCSRHTQVVRCVSAETARALQREAQQASFVLAGFVHPPSSPLARPASKPSWQHEELHGRPGDRVVVRRAGVATCRSRCLAAKGRSVPPRQHDSDGRSHPAPCHPSPRPVIPPSRHARWRRPRSLPPRSLRRWRFRSAPSRSSCCCSASFFGRDTASPGATLTQPRPARWTAATTAALAAAAAARAVTRAVARRTGASSCHRLPRALTRARSPLRLARAAAPLPAPSIPVPEYMLLRWSRKVF